MATLMDRGVQMGEFSFGPGFVVGVAGSCPGNISGMLTPVDRPFAKSGRPYTWRVTVWAADCGVWDGNRRAVPE